MFLFICPFRDILQILGAEGVPTGYPWESLEICLQVQVEIWKWWPGTDGKSILRVGGGPEQPLVQHFVRNVFPCVSWNDFFSDSCRFFILIGLTVDSWAQLLCYFWHAFLIQFLIDLGGTFWRDRRHGRGRPVKYAESDLLFSPARLPLPCERIWGLRPLLLAPGYEELATPG